MINNTTTSVLLTVLQTSMQQCDYLKEVIGEDNSFIEILLKRAVDIKIKKKFDQLFERTGS